MKWSNLQQSNCPKCDKHLQYRKSGSSVKTKTRTRDNIAKGMSLDKDFFFCFYCKFQISKDRMTKLAQKFRNEDQDFAKKHGLKLLA